MTRQQWRKFVDSPAVEWGLFVVGLLLLFVVAPLVGAIPGPGGVVVAGIGLGLILKTSMWAKRRYVRFKRWQPKAGGWADWARFLRPRGPESCGWASAPWKDLRKR